MFQDMLYGENLPVRDSHPCVLLLPYLVGKEKINKK